MKCEDSISPEITPEEGRVLLREMSLSTELSNELASLNIHELVYFCNKPPSVEALERQWFEVVSSTIFTAEMLVIV